MAFTTPKTDFIASVGFAYTDINKTNENIRVLAGGDNTLPLSTDAATGKALAKRDADGDIAFRDIAARDIAVSRDIIWPIDIEHDKGGTGTLTVSAIRRIYMKRNCTAKIVATMSDGACKIYKSGVESSGPYFFLTNPIITVTLAVVAGDYIEIFGYNTVVISSFLVSSGSTVFI